MSEFPLGYEKISPTTWVYLSSILMIGLYFKFNRYWCMRNLDLVLLILLAPGLLLAGYGNQTWLQALQIIKRESAKLPAPADPPPAAETTAEERVEELAQAQPQVPPELQPYLEQYQKGKRIEFMGFVWLFCVGPLWVARLLSDVLMVRRPLLQPNLSPGGLAFLGASLLLFLMANVITSTPTEADMSGARAAEKLIAREALPENDESLQRQGPGFALFHLLPVLPTNTFIELRPAATHEDVEQERQEVRIAVAKTMAIASHLAIVIGIICIGLWHFNNVHTGIGVATLYLMLPYTAQMTGRVEHVLPAAMLVWAVFFYRRPLTAGVFLGLAIGMIYYPLFLLPLWISFYRQRGLGRLLLGVGLTLLISVISLTLVSENVAAFWENVRGMFGLWAPRMSELQGVWAEGRWSPYYRIPVLTACIALSFTFIFWPAQKNLGTLMSCSAAMMVATQFWHGFGGGLYIAWYLPLLLLTIFRPNLEDRVALSVLGEGWLRRKHVSALGKAAMLGSVFTLEILRSVLQSGV